MVNNTSPYIAILESKNIEYWPEKGGFPIDGPVWEWNDFVDRFQLFARVEETMQVADDSALELVSGHGFFWFASNINADQPYRQMVADGLQVSSTAKDLSKKENYRYINSSWCSADSEHAPEVGGYLLPCDAYEIKGYFRSEETERVWVEKIYIKFCMVPDGRCVIFVSFHPSR